MIPPKLLGPAEITFFVPDVSQALPWYRTLFGPPVFNSEHFSIFQGPGIEVGIHLGDAKTNGTSGRTVLYWRVENLHDAMAAMVVLGCRVYREPIIGSDGPAVCQLEDPFGNVWGLRQA